MKLRVIVKTKSNYKNLNGQYLDVYEIIGRRVTVKYFENETGNTLTIDFTLDEVLEFKPGI